MRARTLRVLIAAGGGIAGILGAHALGYFAVLPDGAHRHELLLRTGHGYWPHALALGLAALLIASLVALGAGFSGAVRPRRTDAAALALIQVGGYVSLEAVERIGAGPGATRLIVPLLAVGIALQVVVAMFGAWVLRLLARAGARIASLLRTRTRDRRRSRALRPRPVAIPGSRVAGAVGGRAPPFSLAA